MEKVRKVLGMKGFEGVKEEFVMERKLTGRRGRWIWVGVMCYQDLVCV